MNTDQLIAKVYTMQTDFSTIVLSLIEQLKQQDLKIAELEKQTPPKEPPQA